MNQYGRQRFQYDMTAFVVPMILVGLVFWTLGITPFGSHNLLISDMGTQYVAWLTQFRHAITTGQFSFYSFSLSLGDNAFPLVAYYMLSPFNLLLFFFPANQVPLAITFIILLKVGTIGFSMSYYLRRVYHNTNWQNLIFSTVFSLSGFVATYFYDIMWLDALILLPLVILGLRRLVNNKGTVLYFFALWATIVTNYYLGYMTCLFALTYFVYFTFDQQTEKQSWKQWWHHNAQAIKRFLITSVLSGLSTLFVLIPTLLGMLKTSKQSLSWQAFLPTPQFGLDGFAQLGLNAADYPQRLEHDPSIFVGSFALLLVLLFFLNKTITNHHKRTTGALLAFLGLSMFLTLFNTIWHMMQQPNGFPFRDAYFFTFIVVISAYEAWQTGAFKQTRLVMRAALIAIVLLAIGYLTAMIVQPIVRRWDDLANFYVSPRYWLIATGFIICIAALLILYNTQHWHRLALSGIVLVTVFELSANFYFGLKPAQFGNQTIYQKNFTIEKNYFNKIRRASHAFYRVDNSNSLINAAFGETYNNYNDPLLFNSHGIDLYSSTLNESTRVMLNRLGFYSKNERRISSEGSTHLTNALFAVKYQLQMTPHDYDLIVHDHALPLGFAVNDDLLNVKLKGGVALENQNNVWQAITGRNIRYFKSVNVRRTGYEYKNKQYRYQLIIRPTATGTLYAYFPNVSVANANIHVNGTKKTTRLDVSTQAVLSLGNFKKGERVHINLTSKTPLTHLAQSLQTLDQQSFNQSLIDLHKSTFKLDQDWRPDHLQGTITATKKKPLLFLSIPKDNGWHAYVDGKQVSIDKVVGNLSAIKLTPGVHRIRLTYRAPGFRLGLIISLVSFASYLLFLWLRFRKRSASVETIN